MERKPIYTNKDWLDFEAWKVRQIWIKERKARLDDIVATIKKRH